MCPREDHVRSARQQQQQIEQLSQTTDTQLSLSLAHYNWSAAAAHLAATSMEVVLKKQVGVT